MAYANNAADTVWPDLAEMDAREWDYILLKAHIGYGISTGCKITQRSAGANMSVDVAAGSVYVAFAGVQVTAVNVVIAAANATFPRFDLVEVNSSGTVAVKQGSASVATSPIIPTPDANNTVLGLVYVPANASSITTDLVRGANVPLGQHGANLHSGNPVPVGAYVELSEIAAAASATDKSRIYRDNTLNALMAHSDGRTPAPLEGIESLAAGKLTSSGANITLTIPARDLLVVEINALFSASAKIPVLQFNSDTAAHYAYAIKTIAYAGTTIADSSSASATSAKIGNDAGTNMQRISLTISNYATKAKSIRIDAGGTSTNPDVVFGGAFWNDATNQITTVKLFEVGGANFAAGTSMAIFGFNAGVNYD